MQDSPLNVHHFRVRAHHTDLNGGMHHARFLDVFDDARIETFRRLGYPFARVEAEGWAPVIRSLHSEYFLPARMDDLLVVEVTVPRATRATMTIGYRCIRQDDLVAQAEVVFAFVNPQGRPLRVPTGLRETVALAAEVLKAPTLR
jgi:acyl-CoA thioester hydrolase